VRGRSSGSRRAVGQPPGRWMEHGSPGRLRNAKSKPTSASRCTAEHRCRTCTDPPSAERSAGTCRSCRPCVRDPRSPRSPFHPGRRRTRAPWGAADRRDCCGTPRPAPWCPGAAACRWETRRWR